MRRGWVSPRPYPWWAGSWRSPPWPPCTGRRSGSGPGSQTSPQHQDGHHGHDHGAQQESVCYLVLFTFSKLSSDWKLYAWLSNLSEFKFFFYSISVNRKDLKSTVTLLQDSTQIWEHNTWSKLLGSESTEVKMLLEINFNYNFLSLTRKLTHHRNWQQQWSRTPKTGHACL